MQSSNYPLPQFGTIYEYENESVGEFLLEAAKLSYRVIHAALRAFNVLAIPIWVAVVLSLG